MSKLIDYKIIHLFELLKKNLCFFFSGSIFVPYTHAKQVHGTFAYFGNKVIHIIEGIDRTLNQTGGTIVSMAGGVSSYNLTLLFESDVSAPINFNIRINGA